MGIVYHSNYLCFFERARTEMLRANGLKLIHLAENDTVFAIKEVKLHYISPARLDDELLILTSINNRSSCSIIFEQEMRNQDNALLCRGEIKVVCLNKTLKPKRLPDSFLQN